MCEAEGKGGPVVSREPWQGAGRCCPDACQLADEGDELPSLARCQSKRPLDFSEGNESAGDTAETGSVFICLEFGGICKAGSILASCGMFLFSLGSGCGG